MEYKFKDGLEFAKQLDKSDKLNPIRNRFYINEGEIYMDGNSLGLCSKDAEESLLQLFNVWRREGIKIWSVDNNRYLNFSSHIAQKLKDLIHSDADEIIVMGSITTNLHQGIATFYTPTKDRYKIIVDDLNFPTDIDRKSVV